MGGKSMGLALTELRQLEHLYDIMRESANPSDPRIAADLAQKIAERRESIRRSARRLYA